MSRFTIISFIILLAFSLGASSSAYAQPVAFGDYPQPDTLLQKENEEEAMKPRVVASAGTSYMGYGNGSGVSSSYIAPELAVPVNKRLTMSVGLGYSMMFMNSNSELGFGQSSASYGNVYVSGTYQVNEKLTVRGTAYKTFALDANPVGARPLNSQFFDFSSQGIQMDAEYRVSNNFRIGVSVQYQDGNSPSLCPSNGGGFNTQPFNASPFRFSN